MGNVCSSGQKKKKDSVSEKSDESPAYHIADHDETYRKSTSNEKLAPLADPESVPDPPNSADSVKYAPATLLTQNTNNNPTTSNNDGKHCSANTAMGSSVHRAGSNASTNINATNTQAEPSEGSSVLSLLQGKPPPGGKIEREKKIVLYVLADNTPEYRKHKRVVYNMQQNFAKQCRARGFDFLIADAHESPNPMIKRDMTRLLDVNKWTRSPLDAEGGHAEAANCMAELSRHAAHSYVIPILFLGNNLGQPMLPLTIESQDFVNVLSAATEDERVVLEKWYTIDNSYQPMCHRLHTENLNPNVDQLNEELNELLQLLLKLFTDDLKDSYLTTVVEQEINNTVLMSQELAKRCIWVQCGTQNIHLPDNPNDLDKEVFRRLTKIYTELKSNLAEKNIIRIMQSISILDEELMAAIKELMERIVTTICDEHHQRAIIPYNTNGIDRTLLKELYEIGHFSKLMAQNAANFDIMNDVKRYIRDNTQYPLVVFGSNGCGKTVLSSKIMENIHRWKPETHLILRYANLSVHSADIVSMLGSIANQMSILSLGHEIKCEHTLENYAKIIQDILDSCKYFFVIIIDGVDELLQEDSLQWLPINLNSMSKIILTATEYNSDGSISNDDDIMENNAEYTMLRALSETGIPNRCFLRMKHFTQQQWQDILSTGGGDYYAANGALKLPNEWKQLQGKTPFNAKSLWWLAWLGHFHIKINDINDVVVKMLEVLESEFTTDHVEFMLLMVSLSIHGICETDCLGILQKYAQLDGHTTYRMWSKFCWLMGPLMLYMKNVRTTDRTFRSAIVSRYSQKRWSVHQVMRDYFDRQEPIYANAHGSQRTIYNVQKFLKLPYHHFCSILEDHDVTPMRIDTLFNCFYFTDMQWIVDKVHASGAYNLLHDLLAAEWLSNTSGNQPCVHITFLKDFLKVFMHELRYDGTQFLTLIKYYLKICIRADPPLGDDEKIRSWLEFTNELKIPFLEICNPSLGIEFSSDDEPAFPFSEQVKQQQQQHQQTPTGAGGSNITDGEGEVNINSYDVLVNLPQRGFYVASLSTERDEISIWDVQSCQRIRTLTGIPQPTAMCPVANYEAAVLCRREIKVINLDEGNFKVTLKGVMNQKMPYFGLHDQNHLVCLSRNRMYVNLMNLDSGDCVTTFKAGEDRFLNSLLVSGDGRILVCGDETQKPFPLLVWHLTQRKLLYDLRIPHHDFITTLSAITYEGSYVCVVAKELNEPTPNFIVVYDLQSGTLFKKWKPNCNTVALAISQVNACVIAGLENAKILIWDLVTGNCRSTLIGHNAAVDFLKLDPLGKVLLSRNKEGRDKAIRVWELTSGKLLAAYKPPGRVVTCEILPNGSHIVLALKKRTELLILALKNFVEPPDDDCFIYGNQDNHSKVFKLNIT